MMRICAVVGGGSTWFAAGACVRIYELIKNALSPCLHPPHLVQRQGIAGGKLFGPKRGIQPKLAWGTHSSWFWEGQ